ncbi:uncharacterized protein VTP21DRAFT_6463 [Calcarisporiella thermophila]|uniref:uncharacterized protein n=1 Tax=Calcarisporiella thermophila TaxID=911321 RepID=UPI003744818C
MIDSFLTKLRISKTNTCIRCRERRIKCDQKLPRCTRCELSNRECVYASSSVLITTKELREFGEYVNMLERELEELEGSYRQTEERLRTTFMQQTLAHTLQPRSSPTDIPVTWSIHVDAHNRVYVQTQLRQVKDLHRFLVDHLHLDDQSQLQNSSLITSKGGLFSFDTHVLEYLLLEDIQDYGPPLAVPPGNAIVAQLIEVYFSCFHTFCPIIHKPTFLRSYSAHHRDQAFLANMFAICAHVSRHAQQLHHLHDGLGEQFFSLARNIISQRLEEENLNIVYALLFLAEYLTFDTRRSSQRYLFQGIAATKLHSLFNQRRGRRDSHLTQPPHAGVRTPPPAPSRECLEIYHRLLWYLKDCEDNDFACKQTRHHGPIPLPAPLPDEDERVRHSILYWRACIELARVELDIERLVYDQRGDLHLIRGELESWLSSLPEPFQSPNLEFSTEKNAIFALLANGQFHVNLLKLYGAQLSSAGALTTCLESVHRLLQICELLQCINSCFFPLPFVTRVCDFLFQLSSSPATNIDAGADVQTIHPRCVKFARKLSSLVRQSRHFQARMPQCVNCVQLLESVLQNVQSGELREGFHNPTSL